MPAPSTSLSTLRPDLASFFEFDLEAQKKNYIALEVAPVVEVALQADNPGKIPIEQLLKVSAGRPRGSGAAYDRGSWTFTSWSYATMDYGHGEPLDDRDRKRYQHLVDAEQVCVARAYNDVLLNAEIRMAALLFSDAWIAGGATLYTDVGTTEWAQANWATATPIAHVEAAIRKVWENSGVWPNALVLNRTKFRDLRQCTEIRERIVASGAGTPAKASDITKEMLASVFDLDKVVVAGSAKDSAVEGQSTTIASIFGDYAMVCKIATGADIREPCVARTFHWSENGSSIGGMIKQYREEDKHSDIYEVSHDVDEVVMYTELAHVIGGI